MCTYESVQLRILNGCECVLMYDASSYLHRFLINQHYVRTTLADTNRPKSPPRSLLTDVLQAFTVPYQRDHTCLGPTNRGTGAGCSSGKTRLPGQVRSTLVVLYAGQQMMLGMVELGRRNSQETKITNP